MPLIKTDIKSKEIDVQGTKTLVLDINNGEKLDKEQYLSLSLSNVRELKSSFDENTFSKIFSDKTEEWSSLQQEIKDIEAFYNLIWKRTELEVLFLTKYYIDELRNPNQFEMIYGEQEVEFNYWFTNILQYNFLVRLKHFYIETGKFYARNSKVDIFEYDIENSAKEVVKKVEEIYLDDIKINLDKEWNKAIRKHEEFAVKSKVKKDSLIFD